MYCAMVLSSTQCTDVEWIKEHAGFSEHIRVISLLEYYWGWTSYLQLLKTALFLLTLLIFLRMKDSFLFHTIPSYFISYTRTTHRSIHDLMFISRSMGVGAEDTGKHESGTITHDMISIAQEVTFDDIIAIGQSLISKRLLLMCVYL